VPIELGVVEQRHQAVLEVLGCLYRRARLQTLPTGKTRSGDSGRSRSLPLLPPLSCCATQDSSQAGDKEEEMILRGRFAPTPSFRSL
jgi:hypothetical protein